MTQPPANWYPDPGQQGQLRYWDGNRWTTDVAPHVHAPQAPGTAPVPAKGGMPAWAIVLIVVPVAFVIIGILAAIAIPVFLNQREKAADAAARTSVHEVAAAITFLRADHPDEIPTVEAFGSAVTIDYASGGGDLVALEQGVAFGGFTATSPEDWCVWVTAERGAQEDWMYSTAEGMGPGAC